MGQVVACAGCGAGVRVPPGSPAEWPAAGAAPGPPLAPPTNPRTAPNRAPRCSRLIYIVLAITLGGLGVHNFVAGRTGIAIAQLSINLSCILLLLCTVGLSAIGILGVYIWTLVEIVVVTEDGSGVPFN
ncbi:MAG: hypothetical protein AB7G11_13455 [Phycisphaerales bacterium]